MKFFFDNTDNMRYATSGTWKNRLKNHSLWRREIGTFKLGRFEINEKDAYWFEDAKNLIQSHKVDELHNLNPYFHINGELGMQFN